MATPQWCSIVKTLTLTQPWATLVALELKRFETRSWQTTHRGPLAIHAAKGFAPEARAFAEDVAIPKYLLGAGIRTADLLPRGVIICTVELEGCHRIHEWNDEQPAEGPSPIYAWREDSDTAFWPGQQERELGDWSPGRFAWELEGVEIFEQQLQVRGQLGLWDCDIDRLRREQL